MCVKIIGHSVLNQGKCLNCLHFNMPLGSNKSFYFIYQPITDEWNTERTQTLFIFIRMHWHVVGFGYSK